jgi:hypothetical protein
MARRIHQTDAAGAGDLLARLQEQQSQSHRNRYVNPFLKGDWSGVSNYAMTVGVGKWNLVWQDPATRLGNVNIAAQEQRPDNPGIRRQAFSTHGASIPVSIGRRPVVGNVVDCSDITPRLVGQYDYYVDYQVPIYEDNPNGWGCVGEGYAISGTCEFKLNWPFQGYGWHFSVERVEGTPPSPCAFVGYTYTVTNVTDKETAVATFLAHCGCGDDPGGVE